MPYTYECLLGHANGCWPDADASRLLANGDACYTCGAPTFIAHYHSGDGQVIQDSIPQHWNPAFPEPVHSKTQVKRLQKQFGTSDYEPSAGQKERDKHARERTTFERDHRR